MSNVDNLLPRYDLDSGQRALAKINFANPREAVLELVHLLDAILASPPASDQYLPLLEQIRDPLEKTSKALCERFVDRALPLIEGEEGSFHLVITAYRRMVNAYSQLVQFLANDTQQPWYPYRMAVLLQRILFYTSEVAQAHYLARRELPAGLWVDLHRSYARAESLGVQDNRVDDPLETHRQASSCAAVYVAAQLLALASPYSLNLRSQRLVTAWSGLWAPLVTIGGGVQGSQLPPYVVNLSLDEALVPTDSSTQLTPFIRFLNTSRLDLEIRRTLQKLREKTPPARLGLGEDAPAFIVRLVGRIARPWAQLIIPRRYRRIPAHGSASVSIGFEAIHYHLSGKEFSAPDSNSVYTRDLYESRMSLWHQVDAIHSLPPTSVRVEYIPDTWKQVDSSTRGCRLMRSSEGKRVQHGQLVGVRTADDGPWAIAVASLLTQENRGGLCGGFFVFPGQPAAVAVARIPDDPTTPLEFVRAFLLPATPGTEDETSLIVPNGTFYPSRRFELRQDKKHRQGTMKGLLDKGADFERISFTLD